MARRGRGEGSIYQRADGQWVAVVNLGWVAGKRKRKTLYGKTRREVATKLTLAQRDQSAGQLTTGQVPTVEMWMRYWLDHIVKESARTNTYASHKSKTDRYIVPLLGGQRLDKLQPEHIQAAYSRLRANCPTPPCSHEPRHDLSESTIRQTHAILKRALKIAVRQGKIGRNPVDLVEPPSTKQQRREALTAADARKILTAADRTDSPGRWYVAIMMGLRQGEALALQWADINFQTGYIHVRQSVSRVPGIGLVLNPPKSDASTRMLRMPTSVSSRLMVEWSRHLERMRALGRADEALAGYVWHRPDGSLQDPKHDWEQWRDLLAAAGVPHVALHAARHTAGTLLRESGADMKTIADILGHASTQITERFYISKDTSIQAAAMDQLDALLADDAKQIEK